MARISVASDGENPHPIVPHAHLNCPKFNQFKYRGNKNTIEIGYTFRYPEHDSRRNYGQ